MRHAPPPAATSAATSAATPAPGPARIDLAAAARAARTRRLLEGPIGPTLARLAAPNILAMLVTAAVSIAEGSFAGRLGVTELAGLALVFPLVMLTQMLSAGSIGGAISAAVARALGAGEPGRAAALALAAWIVAAALALASALLMAAFGAAGFAALGGAGGPGEAALAYAAVFFPGCIALWLCHATLSVIRGSGDMLTPSLVLAAVALGSIPLSGALALGWGPFPALGMAGLAWGPVLAHALGAAVGLGHVLSGRAGLSFRGRAARPRPAQFADILRVGGVASLSALQTVVTVVLITGLVARHGGADGLAGYGLGARLEFLMVPVVFGIGAAMTAMVGANIGAGRPDRALRVAWTGSLAAAAIVGSVGAAVALAPDLWLRLFLGASETAALEAGRAYFRTVAPVYALFGLGLALYFASQGAGRVGWPVAAGFARLAVAVGGAALLADAAGLGLAGVFVGIAAGMTVYGLGTAAALRMTGWGPRRAAAAVA